MYVIEPEGKLSSLRSFRGDLVQLETTVVLGNVFSGTLQPKLCTRGSDICVLSVLSRRVNLVPFDVMHALYLQTGFVALTRAEPFRSDSRG